MKALASKRCKHLLLSRTPSLSVTYSKLTHELAREGRGLKPSGPASDKGTQNEEEGCREPMTTVGR